jgi:membrane associated rhomboid family serine protease/DNA-binding beta-propeller fold protein YncE
MVSRKNTNGNLPGLHVIKSPTLWLILINVGIALLMVYRGVDPIHPTPHDLTTWGGNLGAYTLTDEWQRLLYAMFLHGGALHLALNMFLLFQIGRVSEAAWGRLRFLGIYLVTGLFGSLASAWWNALEAVNVESSPLQQALGFVAAPNMVVSIGASGALLGAAGALLVHAMRAGDQSHVDRNVILQVVLLNIGMGFLISGTDNAAHIGGALSGILIGAGLMEPRDRAPRLNPVVRSAAVFGVMLLALGGLALKAAPEGLDQVAAALRKADAEHARREERAARKRQAEQTFEQERASIPAPVSRQAASGAAFTLKGDITGHTFQADAGLLYVGIGSDNSIGKVSLGDLELLKQWQGPALAPDKNSGCPDNMCRGVGAAGIAPSKDGKWAMVSSLVPDSVTRIDLETGKAQWSVKTGRYPRDTFLSDNERYAFVVNGPDNSVSVVDVAQQKLLFTRPIGKDMRWAPFGRWIGATKGKGILYLADAADNAILTLDTEQPGELKKVLELGNVAPSVLALSADGRRLFVAGSGGLYTFDTRTFDHINSFSTCSENTVREFAVSPDGKWIAVESEERGTVHIISAGSQRTMRAVPAPQAYNAMRFSKDGKALYMLSAANGEGVIRRFDLSRTLDVAAIVEEQGELFCTGPDEAE